MKYNMFYSKQGVFSENKFETKKLSHPLTLILKSTTGHGPQPVSSTSHPHNLFSYEPSNVILPPPILTTCFPTNRQMLSSHIPSSQPVFLRTIKCYPPTSHPHNLFSYEPSNVILPHPIRSSKWMLSQKNSVCISGLPQPSQKHPALISHFGSTILTIPGDLYKSLSPSLCNILNYSMFR
jgi:hypothetical protein